MMENNLKLSSPQRRHRRGLALKLPLLTIAALFSISSVAYAESGKNQTSSEMNQSSSQSQGVLEKRKDLQCRAGKYGLEIMENRRLQNEFCMQHAARTCCDHHDAERIQEEWKALFYQDPTSMTKVCHDALSEAFCSHCDPDIVS